MASTYCVCRQGALHGGGVFSTHGDSAPAKLVDGIISTDPFCIPPHRLLTFHTATALFLPGIVCITYETPAHETISLTALFPIVCPLGIHIRLSRLTAIFLFELHLQGTLLICLGQAALFLPYCLCHRMHYFTYMSVRRRELCSPAVSVDRHYFLCL
ncbi:hypothetical protein AVEN_192263-1 [Araneus ventricosus]|uniref:Uncharacterized protein n=1 Tax=Araneus ventricosus TaxID=182803 RepID=A0A4Y2WAV4_ARAVE|nr:hypothetical protein AVEN_192263-1 [Araneus ventricosus]